MSVVGRRRSLSTHFQTSSSLTRKARATWRTRFADRQTIMRVVETWRRMNMADDLAVLLKHDDERVLEHERLAARSAADAG